MRDTLGFIAFIVVAAVAVISATVGIVTALGDTVYRVDCVMPEYHSVVRRSNAASASSPRFVEVETGKVVLLPMDRCVFVEVE